MDTRGPRPDIREADLMPTGKLYWTAVEPIWKKVSIYEGPATFLKQFKAVTRAQAHLLAVHWTMSEVSNGGFGQYFFNDTGVLAPEAADGFEFVGLSNGAAFVRQATAFFGADYPRERAARIAALEKPGKKKVSLSALDRKFFAWDRKDDVAAALDAFVFRNADLFFRKAT